MTTSGHHDDGSRGISAYVDDPKKIRNAHIINKSYIENRKSYIVKRISNAFDLVDR